MKLLVALAFVVLASAMPELPKPIRLEPPVFEAMGDVSFDNPAEIAAEPVKVVDSAVEADGEIPIFDAPLENFENIVEPVRVVDSPLESEVADAEIPAEFEVEPVRIVDSAFVPEAEPVRIVDSAFVSEAEPVRIVDSAFVPEAAVLEDFVVEPVKIVDAPVDAEAEIPAEFAVDPVRVVDTAEVTDNVDTVHVVDLASLPVEADDATYPIHLVDFRPLIIPREVMEQYEQTADSQASVEPVHVVDFASNDNFVAPLVLPEVAHDAVIVVDGPFQPIPQDFLRDAQFVRQPAMAMPLEFLR